MATWLKIRIVAVALRQLRIAAQFASSGENPKSPCERLGLFSAFMNSSQMTTELAKLALYQ
jgi:hypothetical protein